MPPPTILMRWYESVVMCSFLRGYWSCALFGHMFSRSCSVIHEWHRSVVVTHEFSILEARVVHETLTPPTRPIHEYLAWPHPEPFTRIYCVRAQKMEMVMSLGIMFWMLVRDTFCSINRHLAMSMFLLVSSCLILRYESPQFPRYVIFGHLFFTTFTESRTWHRELRMYEFQRLLVTQNTMRLLEQLLLYN